ncbi:histidine kinase [Sphingobacterium endophyticum]|uniref:histidine kinase n=1 Tax=Sphingobacterium endophyticum TaxID=2546448 RepID=UPI0012E29311|nr:histidine kinase [Sphingobacterium endophyticum]
MLTSKDNINKWSGRKYTLLEETCKNDFLCFDVFFQEGPFAIIVLGKSFHVIRVNGRFDYIIGLTGKALIGRDIFEFLDSEDATTLRNIFENRDSFRKPLLISLGFRQIGKAKLSIETFVKKFNNSFNQPQYCLLLFDKEFYPHHHWIELKKEVFQAIVETQEQERNRIGHQLHDSVAQTLYAIKLNCQRLINEKHLENSVELDSIKDMLNSAINQVRNISTDLVPAVLHDFGLKAAIDFMIKRLSMPEFSIQSKMSKKAEELGDDMKLAIYRIIQELLNNCLKHSKASQVDLKVVYNSLKVKIQIKDNGIGFSKSLLESMKNGTGLRSIKNRIDLYQGEISVDQIKTGSLVEITFNTEI